MDHLNPFNWFCPGLKFLGYFIIILVAAIVAVSYYAVVVLTWGPQLKLHHSFSAAGGGGGFLQSFLAFIIIAVFHLLLGLLLWCYFMVMFSNPGSVPQNWRPITGEEEVEDGVPEDDGQEGRPHAAGGSYFGGYCSRCLNGKPPRCHHCSVCQRCVLKMDHHCIWVVNCVGARNYKFFLLFLVYTFAETALDTIVLLPSIVKFFHGVRNHSASPGDLAVTFLAFLLNLAFVLSLLCFIIIHASLLSTNTTSIEIYEKKKGVRWKYDLGWTKNFEQVFGTKKTFWLLPLFSKEDLENTPALQGLDFPVHSDIEVFEPV